MTRPSPPRFYRVLVALARPLVSAISRPRRWIGAEHLPGGAFLAVANHTSMYDPLTVLHFLTDHGVWPRTLAKASLWRVPVLSSMVRGVGAIPVERDTDTAKQALIGAVGALQGGEAVLVYPEGTTTLDPDLWPMVAKTGAARIALATRVPVIPIAEWGAHLVLPPDSNWLRPFPAKPTQVSAGAPVDLSDLFERADDPLAWREASERIMSAITELLAEIRQQQPPTIRWDRRLPDGGR